MYLHAFSSFFLCRVLNYKVWSDLILEISRKKTGAATIATWWRFLHGNDLCSKQIGLLKQHRAAHQDVHTELTLRPLFQDPEVLANCITFKKHICLSERKKRLAAQHRSDIGGQKLWDRKFHILNRLQNTCLVLAVCIGKGMLLFSLSTYCGLIGQVYIMISSCPW